ncbi:proteolipid protein 2 [Hoplias malabaricus]|uniref:proteolipid protein 2 n=1 Tax=Hoplias malabaricus TaxID=27720 RepID=UPI003461F1F1
MADDNTQGPQSLQGQSIINYIKTRKGIILLTESVLSLFIIICFSCSLYGQYIMVPIWELVSTLIIFFIFALDLQNLFKFINFPWTDFFRAITSCIIYFIISLLCVFSRWKDGPQITGGIFGIMAAVVYGYDVFLILTDIKINKRQNENVVIVGV